MDDASEVPAAPAGFEPMERSGAFWRLSGPYFERPGGERVEQAFFARPEHSNNRGIVHGGMLSAFLDGLLAQAARGGRGRPTALTVHLSIDFLSAARVGEWVIGEAVATRKGAEIVFAEGRVHVDGRDVVRGSGVFRAAPQSDR